MKKLLSEKDFRLVQLIELIYIKEELLQCEASLILNVNNRTLKADIDRANHMFSPIEIIVTGKKGIKIIIPKNYSLGYVYTCLLSESKEFNILEKIFICETYSIDKLAEEMYISSSSLRRMIMSMNEVLTGEGMNIKLNPLRIVGNESAIINFYVHYLDERYPLNKVIFKMEQVTAIKDMVNYLIKRNNIELDIYEKKKLETFLLVKLIRIKNGHSFQINFTKDSKIDFIFDVALIQKRIENAFHVMVNKELLYELFNAFLNGRYSFSYKELIQSSAINPQVKETLSRFEKFVELVLQEFQIKLSKFENEKLLLNLCNIGMLQFGKPFILYDFILDVIQHFNKDYSEEILLIMNLLKKIFKGENIEEYELNNYVYVLIVYLEKYFIEIEKQMPILTVAIIFHTDQEHIKIIQNEIYHRFKNKIQSVIITDSFQLEKILAKEIHYDLIITNISALFIPNSEVLCFSIYPEEKDWSELLNYYNSTKQGKSNKNNRLLNIK